MLLPGKHYQNVRADNATFSLALKSDTDDNLIFSGVACRQEAEGEK